MIPPFKIKIPAPEKKLGQDKFRIVFLPSASGLWALFFRIS